MNHNAAAPPRFRPVRKFRAHRDANPPVWLPRRRASGLPPTASPKPKFECSSRKSPRAKTIVENTNLWIFNRSVFILRKFLFYNIFSFSKQRMLVRFSNAFVKCNYAKQIIVVTVICVSIPWYQFMRWHSQSSKDFKIVNLLNSIIFIRKIIIIRWYLKSKSSSQGRDLQHITFQYIYKIALVFLDLLDFWAHLRFWRKSSFDSSNIELEIHHSKHLTYE